MIRRGRIKNDTIRERARVTLIIKKVDIKYA